MKRIIEEKASDTERPHTRAPSQPILGPWHEALHARVALHLGDFDEAERRAEVARDLAHKREDALGEGLALRMLAHARAKKGAGADEVDKLLGQSHELHTQAGCVLEAARTQRDWGELLLERGDKTNATLRLNDALRTFTDRRLTSEAERTRSLI
jgi:hypothetical protein